MGGTDRRKRVGHTRGRVHHLNVRGVKHDTDGRAQGVRRKILLKLSSDNAAVTVGSSDLSPHDSDFGSVNLLAGTVYISDSLSKVELSVLSGSNTFNLDERSVGVCDMLAALVGNVLSLNVD